MRVITGSARGTRLQAPDGSNTRPTSEMTKEAVFSVLQFEIERAAVLDLFAGSGQMGIEALSRGAKSCVFVDTSRPAQEIIRQNLAAAKLAGSASVTAMEALAYLDGCRDRFDIAFLDPPYKSALAGPCIARLASLMNGGGVIVCETSKEETLPQQAGDFAIYREYRYGKTKVTTYRKAQQEEVD